MSFFTINDGARVTHTVPTAVAGVCDRLLTAKQVCDDSLHFNGCVCGWWVLNVCPRNLRCETPVIRVRIGADGAARAADRGARACIAPRGRAHAGCSTSERCAARHELCLSCWANRGIFERPMQVANKLSNLAALL